MTEEIAVVKTETRFLLSWSVKSRGEGGNNSNPTRTTSGDKNNINNIDPHVLKTVPGPSHLLLKVTLRGRMPFMPIY